MKRSEAMPAMAKLLPSRSRKTTRWIIPCFSGVALTISARSITRRSEGKSRRCVVTVASAWEALAPFPKIITSPSYKVCSSCPIAVAVVTFPPVAIALIACFVIVCLPIDRSI